MEGSMTTPMVTKQSGPGGSTPKAAAYVYNYQDLEGAMAHAPPSAATGDLGYVGYDLEKQLRLGFIRKVYGILSLQLALTCGMCAVFVFVDPVRNYMLTHSWPFYTSMFGGLALLFVMFCYQNVHPANVILLTLWTISEAVIVAAIVAAYASIGAGAAVVNAAFCTLAIFLALTLFTFQSKIDFSFLGAALFGALWVLVIWGFVVAIFGFRQSFLYSLLGAIIFSLYILYDTSLIIRRLTPDDWVLAVISLYLDIINLFLFLLQLTTRRD